MAGREDMNELTVNKHATYIEWGMYISDPSQKIPMPPANPASLSQGNTRVMKKRIMKLRVLSILRSLTRT